MSTSTSIGAATFGGEGCDPIGRIVSSSAGIGVMYFSTGSGSDQIWI